MALYAPTEINPAHWTIGERAEFIKSKSALLSRINTITTKLDESITALGRDSSDEHKRKELADAIVLRSQMDTLKGLASDFIASIEKVGASHGELQDRKSYQEKFNKMIDHLLHMDGFNKDGELNKVTGPTLFWSKVHQDFAGMLALEKEGKTLESTLPGYLFDGLSFGFPWKNDDSAPLKQFWVRMSHEIASAVKGEHAELHALGHVVPSSAFVTDEWKVTKKQIETGVIKSLLAYIYVPKDTAKRDLYLLGSLPTGDSKQAYAQKYLFTKEPPALYYMKKNLEIVPIQLEVEDRNKLELGFKNINPDNDVPIALRKDVNVTDAQAAIQSVLVEGKNKQGVPYAHKEGVSLKKSAAYEIKTQEDLNKIIGKDMHEDPIYQAIQQKWQDKVKRGKAITDKIKTTSSLLKEGITEIEKSLKNSTSMDKSALQEKIQSLMHINNELGVLQKHLLKNEERMANDLAKLNSLMEKLNAPDLTEATQQQIRNEIQEVSEDMIKIEKYYDEGIDAEIAKIQKEISKFESSYQSAKNERETLVGKINAMPAAYSGVIDYSAHTNQRIKLNKSYEDLNNELQNIQVKLKTLGIMDNQHSDKVTTLIENTKRDSIINDYKGKVTMDEVSLDMASCAKRLSLEEKSMLEKSAATPSPMTDMDKQAILKPLEDCQKYLENSFRSRNLGTMPVADFNHLNAVKVCIDAIKTEMNKDPISREKILASLYALQSISEIINKNNPQAKAETNQPAPPPIDTSVRYQDNSLSSRFSKFFYGSQRSTSQTDTVKQPSANMYARTDKNTADMVKIGITKAITSVEQPLRQEKNYEAETTFRMK